MDLIKNLDSTIWQSIDIGKLTGMKHYTIVRTDRSTEKGCFKYAVKEVNEDEGQVALVILEGARGTTDPLRQVRNVDLRISDNRITAINLDGDAVIRNS